MDKVNENATQSPPNAENAAGQGTVTEPQEPTTEELKQAVLTLTQERQKDKQEVKRMQGLVKNQGVTRTDIAAIRQEFSGLQDLVATALDAQSQGEDGEFNKTPKVSYQEQIKAQRKAAQAQEQTVSPEDQLAFGYAISQGLSLESPEVIEAFSDGRSGKEAHEYLKSTIAGRSEAKQKETVNAAVQAALKGAKLTQGGVDAPTTGGNLLTKEKVASMSSEEVIVSQEQILADMVEGKLK